MSAARVQNSEDSTLRFARLARHFARFVLAVLFVGAAAYTAAAQSSGAAPLPPGYREYLLLLGTPAASLPPQFTYTLTGIAQQSPELVARYGYVPDITRPLAPEVGGHAAHSLDSFGLSGIIPLGLDGTVSLTGGVSNERCSSGCPPAQFMGSVAGDYRLARIPIGVADDAMRLTVGLSGELGIGSPESGLTETVTFGLPLAVGFGQPDATQVIPFITPSIGLIASGAQGIGAPPVRAGRGLLGGGVALFNPKSALGASIGFQYVFVSHTELQVGIGLSLGGR